MRIRRREDPQLRYYLYVSDAKLDMLFEQIDRNALKRVSAEAKVDLKLASVTLKRAENPSPARMAKLRVVERFIDRHHHVGDIENPGHEYFRGRMAMTWGWLHSPFDVDENGAPPREMVLFQGWRGHHTVGLAGSGQHVLAWNGIHDRPLSRFLVSMPHEILWALNQHVANTPELTDPLRETKIRNGWSDEWSDRQGWGPGFWDTNWANALNTEFFNGPSQQLEFLAVPLAQDNSRIDRAGYTSAFDDRFAQAHNTILGTPLYVALAPGHAQLPQIDSDL